LTLTDTRGIALLAVLLFAATLAAEAQPAKELPKIGVLQSGLLGTSSTPVAGFRQGLRELGYAEGKLDRLPDLAAELVRLKVDVIVAVGTPAIRAAKNATSTIPIVFPAAGDPVALGLVASLARPGGNITGLANNPPEFSGKRLELLKEVVPRATRVAVLGQEANALHALVFKDLQAAASTMGLQLHYIEVRSPKDLESAFSKITGPVRATAVFLRASPLFNDNPRRIADLAVRSRLPAISDTRELAEAGVLVSYGSDRFDQGRRAATYVDKMLKGAKPVDLPVEQPTKYEFIVNMKTAKALGLTIPPSILLRADHVIE
jgi:putative ABC transport system substrate-binding protein